MTITLTLLSSSSNNSKIKFTSAEEKTAKGICLRLGILAEVLKEENLSPLQKALITPEIVQAVDAAIDDGETSFPTLLFKAYRKIEASKTEADAATWPVVERAHAALYGMFRRESQEVKVLTEEQALAFWPDHSKKYQKRTVRR